MSVSHEEQRTDAWFMDRALQLAQGGWGRVAPNPLVGAVVVRDGRVLGEGYHAEFGGDHAEVAALRAAGEGARGSTIYVNLEPCSHHGQTPPCTRAIREAGVNRIVVAVRDPHPVAGGGMEELGAAGIEVVPGVRRREGVRLNAPFLWGASGRGIWVTLKLALSLDARIAAEAGERTRLTGPAADAFVHRLRAGHDAILVGGRTALIDDPLLTARAEPEPRMRALRVVLDPELRLPAEARLLGTLDHAPVLILCAPTASGERITELRNLGARVETVDVESKEGLSLDAVLRTLASHDVTSVLVEGGGRLATSFLRLGLVQRFYLVYSPLLLGARAVPAFGQETEAMRAGEWELASQRTLGEDTLLELDERASLEALVEAA
jgi:diaminohydroxyphosphoribosylaminopyrimidine deaminase/5-amino-6-(5-phosphoribosylamino)uracil reductase